MHAALERLDPADRGRDVRRLRVVHVEDAVDLARPPRAGAAPRGTCAAPPRSPPRGTPMARAASVAAAAFSGLCAPRRRTSADVRSSPPRSSRGRIAASPGRWLREDPQLRRAVGSSVAVAVEVVGLDVEQHRALRRERRRRPRAGSSSTRRSPWPRGRPRRPALASGVPTLPATATGSPAARQIAPSSSTVVVLPFVPGHRDERVRQQPPGQLELARAPAARARAPSRPPAPRAARPGS